MDSLFERLLREKITLMIDMRVDHMTSTGVIGINSMEDYRHNLGYLMALKDILSTMDEVNENIRKD